MSRAASPPASASSPRSSRAALENAYAFPQLRTLAGSNPSALGTKKKGPHFWEPIKSVVGDEGCRVRLRRPLPLRRFAPCVLRWKTLTRFLSSAPWRVRILLHWSLKRKAPISGSLSKRVVGDEGCCVRLRRPLPLRRWRASRAALENACAFPQLRTLAGSNPMHWALTRKAPIAGDLPNQVVGDEGFEPPALCV